MQFPPEIISTKLSKLLRRNIIFVILGNVIDVPLAQMSLLKEYPHPPDLEDGEECIKSFYNRLESNLYRFVANLYYHNTTNLCISMNCCRVKSSLCFTKLCA